MCVCVRALRCVDVDAQNDEKRAEGELRGCFAKAARASLSLCCGERMRRFFQSEEEREKRDFQKKSTKKRFSSRFFSSRSDDFEMLVSSLC